MDNARRLGASYAGYSNQGPNRSPYMVVKPESLQPTGAFKLRGAYAAISPLSAATVANSAVRSPVGGDTINNDYQVVIPWVNADTYSVTLNYILANNP